MYFALKKNFTWILFILALFIATPCTILTGVQLWKADGYDLSTIPYIDKVSIGNIFIIKDLIDDDDLILYADIVVYLNTAGIVYLLLHSIYLRRMLINMNIELDEDEVSPNDFALIARNLPTNIS